jgi:hypothetical protein
MKFVALATEDALSEAVGKRLLIDAGYHTEPSPILRKDGFGYLQSKMDSWCEMAKRKPVLLLTDLDAAACPIDLRAAWIGKRKPNENLVLRVAVREIEAWLLADHQALRTLIGNRGKLPLDPDSLPNPKQFLLRLIERQASREIRDELVATAGAIASQGMGYNSRLSHLVATVWDPERAGTRSKSLQRTRNRIAELIGRMNQHQD